MFIFKGNLTHTYWKPVSPLVLEDKEKFGFSKSFSLREELHSESSGFKKLWQNLAWIGGGR